MIAKWKKGYEPSHILKQIEATRRKDAEGNVKYSSFSTFVHKPTLLRMLEYPSEVPHSEARKCLYEALTETSSLNANALLQTIDQKLASYLQTPLTTHIIVTHISIDSQIKIEPISLLNSEIKFENLNEIFQRNFNTIYEKAKHSLFSELATHYLPVQMKVLARSSFEAVDKAINRLDFLRAIWNLYYNDRTRVRMSNFGKPTPVNQIISGQIYTVHDEGGNLLSQRWWYEPSFIEPISPKNIADDVDKLHSFLKKTNSQLQEVSYSDELITILLRYTRALDERNWDNAFLKLWGTLESLTHTQNDSYKTTIKRTAYIYEDKDYARQILLHLRDYRNKLVHLDISDNGIELYMYQLKEFVENLIYFHLNQGEHFSSLKHASEFLNLPTKQDDLEAQKELRALALEFKGYTT